MSVPQNIKQQFPGVTESIYQDIVSASSSRDEALDNLRGFFSPQAEVERQQRLKIEELKKIFPETDQKIISQVLQQNSWNVDAAIVPLVQIHENSIREKTKKERANSLLSQFYSQLSEEEIQRVLHQNNGNADATAARLLEIVEQKEQAKRAREETSRVQFEKDQKIAVLEKKFPDLKRPEITDHLKRKNWDVYLAGKELLRISEGRKIETLQRLFKAATYEEIHSALEAANWEFVGAVNRLTAARLEKKDSQRQQEALKRQEEERKRQLRLRQEDEIEKQRRQQKEREQEEARKQKAKEEAEKSFMERSVHMEDELNAFLQKPRYQELLNGDLIKDSLLLMESKRDFSESLPNAVDQIEISPIDDDYSSSPLSLASQPFNFSLTPSNLFSPSEATLLVEPTLVDSGNNFTVSWAFSDDQYVPKNDWIALYNETEDDPQKYLFYEWTRSDKRKGSIVMKAPLQYGNYRLNYFKNKTYRLLAQSNILSVGPRFDMSADVVGDPSDRKIRVTFSKKSGNDYPNAWVGLYSSTEIDNKNFCGFEWLSNNVNSQIEFVAPKSGTWYFRLFPERSTYTNVASCSVVLPGKDTIKLSFSGVETYVDYDVQTVDPRTEKPWIGLYFVDEKNYRSYRRSQYIYESGKGRIVFKTPIHEGTYHARLFTGNSTVSLLCSNPISVPNAV